MCVIALCEEKRLSKFQVEDMYAANPHGGGVAWHGERDGVKVVEWRKGLNLAEMVEACMEMPLPYCAHFRIPTCGPREGICIDLCHPFPIHPDVPLDDEGTFDGNVLFHNGSWGYWDSKVLDMACKGNYKLPSGRWSDSRAMAWAAANLGLGVLDFIGEKAVVFGPTVDSIYLVNTPAWTYTADKIWVSNLGWRGRGNFRRMHEENASAKAEKEEHSPSQSVTSLQQTEDGNSKVANGSQTTGTSSTGNGFTATGKTDRFELPRIPSNGGREDIRLPEIYRNRGLGGTRVESPFDRKGRIQLEVDLEIMLWAEALHARKDDHGNRLLSKKKVKKFRKAHDLWVARKKREDAEKAIVKCQQELLQVQKMH